MDVLWFVPVTLISSILVATAYLFCFDLFVFAPVIALLRLREHLSFLLSYLGETQGLNKLCSIWMIHVSMENSQHQWESSFMLLNISYACSGNEDYIEEEKNLMDNWCFH